MSLADNKRSVFTTIGSYNSLMQQGKPSLQTDLYPSINNKKDTVPFLLDVLKTVAGSDALIEIIGGMFGKLVDETEPKLKTALTKQFIQSNSNEPLPANFKNNGITVPVKSIDINGKLKTNPSSTGGALIYDTSTPSFDKTAYDAILNAGMPQNYNNVSITYIEASDSFKIKPIGATTNIGNFFSTYIENTELVNKKELTSAVMDNFYGTVTKNQNKTVDEVYNELLFETQLQQIINGDDSFIIPPEKNDELLAKSRDMVDGKVNYDLGCGLMSAELNINDFSSLISTISGATDPFFIGNQISETINQSTSSTEDQTTENKQTIKDSFLQRIINIFNLKLLQAVTTAPQIRMLFGMMNSLQNNGDAKITNSSEDQKNSKTTINCMSNEIMKLIGAFIFAIAISYLIKLLKPVIKKVIKEKINQYVGVIKSLTGASNKINT